MADALLSEAGFAAPVSTEGAAFTNDNVFQFTDAAGTYAHITDYTATIQLGDGNTLKVNSAGTISGPAGASGQIVEDANFATNHQYDVLVSYTYGEAILAPANATFSVSVADAGGAPAISDSKTPFTVADAALSEAGFAAPVATEGAAFTNDNVFQFTDAAGTYAHITDYTATIQLGDGNTLMVNSAGTISGPAGASGQIVEDANFASNHQYDVLVSYTYGEAILAPANASFSVSVADAGGAPAISDSKTPFTVADAALSEAGFAAPVATEGAAFTNDNVFQFTDAAGNYAHITDYTATIQLGDGNTLKVDTRERSAGRRAPAGRLSRTRISLPITSTTWTSRTPTGSISAPRKTRPSR